VLKVVLASEYKVEAPLSNHLSNFGANGEQYEVVEFYPCRKIGNIGIRNFTKFYFQI